MQPAENPQSDIPGMGSAPRRKHRQGLHRTQIACERCRARKNKCDGKNPSCGTCQRAGAECIITDRLTYQQLPRSHVDDMKAQVQALQEENDALKAQISFLQQQKQHDLGAAVEEAPKPQGKGAATVCGRELAADIGLLSLEGTSERKYVGESSGVYFGKIVGAILPGEAKSLPAAAQLTNPLRFGLGRRDVQKPVNVPREPPPRPILLPNTEMANRLQEAFFSHRWPSLPFLHRPTFLKKHFESVLRDGINADGASLFLTHMVFAIGAIDLRRKNGKLPITPLDYFKTATSFYLSVLFENGNLETIQGLLLLSTFAISEPHALNAWMVSGLAMRSAIELGLHRHVESGSLFQSEMRKRVFWAAYVLDRNISITLGRPLSIQDKDIDVELPLSLSDIDLLPEDNSPGHGRSGPLLPSDLSTFIHIIKLRQFGSRIQSVFYPTKTAGLDTKLVSSERDIFRAELENWIVSAPRYTLPTPAVFQSIEWFQIAYNHALLLLYRPSPACPETTTHSLRICSDASISLIILYLTLYSKNKFAYTWVSLHSLFVATVTMLYTLTRQEIRATTTKNVTESNINSSLSLLQNMADVWPEAAGRCHQVIERLGGLILALFDAHLSSEEPQDNANLLNINQEESFGEIIQNSLDWFGIRQQSCVVTPQPEISGLISGSQFDHHPQQFLQDNSLGVQYNMDEMMDLDGLLEFGFDMSLPLMTDAFDSNNLFANDSRPNQ
ncbi:Positive regulator of purine utilization [Hyphodiscus hymeniophilus]|uniref:Positive regulator of purine utilization n=1 Tax=Hyphodiscus hymeniophilus TaxID=353542 RepID=A0A9P6VKP9_9HELO|nr:Positive regulator of purine utilization [Hyphodiscus hymeniophilus]